MDYTKRNAKAWDSWAKGGGIWTTPISPEEFQRAKQGEWEVYLTPSRAVPQGWFPPMRDCKILGLASGGAQQMPVFTALGAHCTVLDYSESQLQSEREVAAREGYVIETVHADMSKPLPFKRACFDMIFHPVSNVYVEEVQHIWEECFRVLRPGGLLLAGLSNGIHYLFEDNKPLLAVNKLPYNPLRSGMLQRRRQIKSCGGSVQFSHTMEEQVGGQLNAGFQLTHLYEDRDRPGHAAAIDDYIPTYCATRAVKPR